MTIITDSTIIVNPISEKTESEKHIQKWTKHKTQAASVAAKMQKIGLEGRAQRMAQCGDLIEYTYCNDCDTYSISRANLCRDRFCPVCNWRLSLQRYVNMTKILSEIPNGNDTSYFSLITLTVPNCAPNKLRDTLARMQSAWDKLTQRKAAKVAVGWAKSIEITYNRESHTFHPHYHIFVMWEQAQKQNAEKIILAWMELAKKSGFDCSINAQESHSIYETREGEPMAKAICESFKYALKSKTLADVPLGEFKVMVDELSGKRLVSFGGEFKRIANALKINMEEVDSGEVSICRRCGSTAVEHMIYQWSFAEQTYNRMI